MLIEQTDYCIILSVFWVISFSYLPFRAAGQQQSENNHRLQKINPCVVDDYATMFGYLNQQNDWVDGIFTHTWRKANRVSLPGHKATLVMGGLYLELGATLVMGGLYLNLGATLVMWDSHPNLGATLVMRDLYLSLGATLVMRDLYLNPLRVMNCLHTQS